MKKPLLFILVCGFVSFFAAYQTTLDIQPRYRARSVMRLDDPQGVDANGVALQTFAHSINRSEIHKDIIQTHHLLERPEFFGTSHSIPENQLIRQMTSQLMVEQREGTRLIDITVAGHSREFCQDLANWVAEAAVKDSWNQKRADSLKKIALLEREREKLNEKVREAEIALSEFRQEIGILPGGRSLQNPHPDLGSGRNDAAATMAEVKRAIEKYLGNFDSLSVADRVTGFRALRNSDELSDVAFRNRLMLASKEALESLEKQQDPEESALIAARQQRDVLAIEFEQSLRAIPGILKEYLAGLELQSTDEDERAGAEGGHATATAAQVASCNALEREVAATVGLYDSVVQRLAEEKGTLGELVPVASVVEVASRASNTTPSGSLAMILGIVRGIVLGVIGVLIWRVLVRRDRGRLEGDPSSGHS